MVRNCRVVELPAQQKADAQSDKIQPTTTQTGEAVMRARFISQIL